MAGKLGHSLFGVARNLISRLDFTRKRSAHSGTQGSVLAKNNQERAMQNSKTKLSILSLCTMCLLSGAYAQITPSADAYTNTAAASTNYGANVLLYVDGATETTYIQFNLASIPASASVSEATLKLYVNSVTTAGTFNVDYITGAWAERTITANLHPALGAAVWPRKGSETVTRVGLSAPSSDFTVTVSPVTTSGTLGLNWKVAPTSSDTNNAIVKRDSTGSFNVTSISSSGSIAVSGAQTNPLYAASSAPGAFAVEGWAQGTTGQEVGVFGGSSSIGSGSSGVFGDDLSGGGNAYTTGVSGKSANTTAGIGVFGYGSKLSTVSSGYLGAVPVGVWGDSPSAFGVGVFGTSDGVGVYGVSNSKFGVLGKADTGVGIFGESNSSVGVYANNSPSGTPTDLNATLLGENDSSTSQYVLYAENSGGSTYVRTDSGGGNLAATGSISGGSGSVRIDHPLDPTGKYLMHADIESPEMKNLYDGVVQLEIGRA